MNSAFNNIPPGSTVPALFFQSGLLFVAEKITNACLNLDPASKQKLQGYSGKQLLFILRDQVPMYDQGINIFITLVPGGVELSVDSSLAADASVVLFAEDVIPLLSGKLELPSEKIIVEGDQELLGGLQTIASQLDLDWESAIAPYVGDVMAHNIGNRARTAEKWVKSSYRDARRLAEEYIEEELPVAMQSPKLKPLFKGLEKVKAASHSLMEGWTKTGASDQKKR